MTGSNEKTPEGVCQRGSCVAVNCQIKLLAGDDPVGMLGDCGSGCGLSGVKVVLQELDGSTVPFRHGIKGIRSGGRMDSVAERPIDYCAYRVAAKGVLPVRKCDDCRSERGCLQVSTYRDTFTFACLALLFFATM